MCLYPHKIKNRKYIANKKNGGNIPEWPVAQEGWLGPEYDYRVQWIEVPCGQCEECRKQKAHNWQIRLAEELKEVKYPYFVSFTFSPQELEKLCKQTRLKECNAVAGTALRRCLERYRKDHKKSIKHWMITELGHEGTERIHMHGLILSDNPLKFVKSDEKDFYTWKYWKYGLIYVGEYCTLRTINYIVKYINKIDTDHKGFIGQILCSPGLGKSWIQRAKESKLYVATNGKLLDYYTLNNGARVKLPTYYKNHLYTEEERETNWRKFMDREKITIHGNTFDKRKVEEQRLLEIRDKAQEQNIKLGFGDDTGEWRKKPYNVTRLMLQRIEREKQRKIMEEALKAKELAKMAENGIEIENF